MTDKFSNAGFSAIIAAMLILTACSSSNDSDDDNNNESVDSPTTETNGTDETATEPTSVANLPADCGIITTPGGAQFCISAEDDRSVYSLTETGDVNFSTSLPDNVSLANTRIFSGTNLYVLNQTTTDMNSWVVTAIDAGGNIQFTTGVGSNVASVQNGFSIAPFLFLHVVSPAGEPSIIQIDESTGDIGNTLNLAGQTIDRVGRESFDGATFVSIESNGETTYRDSERLEPYARGFSLSADNLQTEFSNLMNITRANYLGQFIDTFNQTNAFASTADAGAMLPCTVSGTVEILPESSSFAGDSITRGYTYDACILIDNAINGTALYRSETSPSTNSTTETNESLSFDGLSISRLIDNADAAGTFNNELFEVTASINNAFSSREFDSAVEINQEVTTTVSRYSQSSANVELVSITDAIHQNKTYQLQQVAEGIATARESGTMTLQSESGITISLQITEPLFYEATGEGSQGREITQAPLAGLVRISSSDGSSLDANANLAGIDQQNYLLNQAGIETSIDGSWNLAPISLQPSLIELF